MIFYVCIFLFCSAREYYYQWGNRLVIGFVETLSHIPMNLLVHASYSSSYFNFICLLMFRAFYLFAALSISLHIDYIYGYYCIDLSIVLIHFMEYLYTSWIVFPPLNVLILNFPRVSAGVVSFADYFFTNLLQFVLCQRTTSVATPWSCNQRVR